MERPIPSTTISCQFCYTSRNSVEPLLTIIRIPTILAINILLQEATVNTTSHLQMPIVCRRRFPGQVIHIRLPITMWPLKHLHHVSDLQPPAGIPAGERPGQISYKLSSFFFFSLTKPTLFLDSLLSL